MSLIDKYKEYKANKKEEDADIARRNPHHLPTKMSIIVRMVAGGYLVYLGYNMRGAVTSYTDFRKWVFLAFIILFAAFGAWACITGIKTLAKREYFDPATDDFSEEAEAAAEIGEPDESAVEPAELIEDIQEDNDDNDGEDPE